MKYKLIAVDMDGTLLSGEKKVTPKTQKSLLAAQSRER
jgi:hydroxymethylpyrimidine pyrophosphatase-like HAD family hydrolase